MDDDEIVERWKKNHEPWSIAVREGRIQSRVLATDAAIVDAVLKRSPANVIDIGCGEGWLVRRLVSCGIDVLGVDVVAELIEKARLQMTGRYQLLSYEQLAAHGHAESFDVCVCNFSLLGEMVTKHLLAAVPALLNPQGALIVQTLHPWVACGDWPYRDGWRPGSWLGIDGAFSEPPPWYFRTIESWMQLIANAGLSVEALLEPINPETLKPASLILVVSLPALPASRKP